jgi:serine/threonine protein kinase
LSLISADSIHGRCPSCGQLGLVGQACGTERCEAAGFHLIPDQGMRASARIRGRGGEEALGRVIEGFLVARQVGSNGFGDVYHALELPDLRTRVLVEIAHDEEVLSSRQAQEIKRVARALASVDHPSILRLARAGTFLGRTFLLTEPIAGGVALDVYLLRCRSEGRAPTFDFARAVGGCLFEALAAAGVEQVVHGSLESSDILVDDADTKSVQVRITGFGRPRPGHSARYAAPEIFRGDPVGAWTDLYAAAAIACELLTGRRFLETASTDLDVLDSTLAAGFDPLSGLPPVRLSEETRAFFSRGLAAEPWARFRSAEEMGAAFHDVIASLRALHGASITQPVGAAAAARQVMDAEPDDDDLESTRALVAAPAPAAPARLPMPPPASDSPRTAVLPASWPDANTTAPPEPIDVADPISSTVAAPSDLGTPRSAAPSSPAPAARRVGSAAVWLGIGLLCAGAVVFWVWTRWASPAAGPEAADRGGDGIVVVPSPQGGPSLAAPAEQAPPPEIAAPAAPTALPLSAEVVAADPPPSDPAAATGARQHAVASAPTDSELPAAARPWPEWKDELAGPDVLGVARRYEVRANEAREAGDAARAEQLAARAEVAHKTPRARAQRAQELAWRGQHAAALEIYDLLAAESEPGPDRDAYQAAAERLRARVAAPPR